MNAEALMLKRRSIRKFKPDAISDEIINKLLVCAMSAPSACNRQPWEFFVIKDGEKLAQIKKASRFSNHNAPLAIVVAGNTKKALPLHLGSYWIQDCSSAITHILLEATDLGLGSLWCGLYPQKGPEAKVRSILSLSESIIPLGLVLIGYPDEQPEPRSQYHESKVHII